MNLKFHMQHNQTAGHHTGKIKPDREFKLVANTKNT